MNYQHEAGRYFLNDEQGKTLAEITYTTINEGKTFSIDHTNVDLSLRGQGIASELLELVVQEARDKQMTIKPICSFARQKFFTTPSYQEIQYK